MPFLLLALLNPAQCSLTVHWSVHLFIHLPSSTYLSVHPLYLPISLPTCQPVSGSPSLIFLPLRLPKSLFASALAWFLPLVSAHKASGFPFSISHNSVEASSTFHLVTNK